MSNELEKHFAMISDLANLAKIYLEKGWEDMTMECLAEIAKKVSALYSQIAYERFLESSGRSK